MIRAVTGAFALLITIESASAAVEQQASKAFSAKIEAQISRLMRWMSGRGEGKTFSAAFRKRAIEKIKELPVDLIADPAIHCMKHSPDAGQFEICLRAAYKPSQ